MFERLQMQDATNLVKVREMVISQEIKYSFKLLLITVVAEAAPREILHLVPWILMSCT
ncbi:hypothetical protein DICVIV_06466 [Dictyocaulus viviparus]|uniref:Uncharacterized protein n=1 Tax=Dictyocaulus viviparus TaxID=29172 RepID=A0A0D8XSD1_DICVI|nr:hypothetical protein DICVIV_06466 [Dictyocaulus viviparus]